MIKGRPGENFWEQNWGLRYVTEVGAMIDEYGEDDAGEYMWAIWLYCHPSSDIFEADPKDKIEWIKLNHLKDEEFVWPEREIFYVPPKPKRKPARKRRKKDEDFDDEEELDGVEMDEDEAIIDIDRIKLTVGFKEKDLGWRDPVDNNVFYRALIAFPKYAMSVEEQDYYGLVRLRQMSRERAEWLNGKDMAAVVKQLASSSPDLDKMKSRYLSWKEQQVNSSGDVQSGGASRRKKF